MLNEIEGILHRILVLAKKEEKVSDFSKFSSRKVSAVLLWSLCSVIVFLSSTRFSLHPSELMLLLCFSGIGMHAIPCRYCELGMCKY